MLGGERSSRVFLVASEWRQRLDVDEQTCEDE